MTYYEVMLGNYAFDFNILYFRFAIDTMQLVCLDEFGGEKAVPPNSQETTLIQHIFGGRLQSQVALIVNSKK